MASVEQQPAPAPEPYDHEKETRQQTELLRSINGKLGFMVFIIIITIIIQVLSALV